MRRREFITLASSAAIAWPLATRAQQPERMRRIGIFLAGLAESDPEAQARVRAFVQGLDGAGWIEGRNIRIDIRWGRGLTANLRRFAAELVRLTPDVLLATGGTSISPLLEATQTIPIVFAQVPDPLGAGIVDSLSRPGGNATGFASFEYNIAGKWLELLKQIAPGATRIAILRDPNVAPGIGQFAVIQAVAPSLRVELIPIKVKDANEMERSVAAFAGSANGGMVVTASAFAVAHRELIIKLAAQHKLPAIYFERHFVTAGALISYGGNSIEPYQLAAGYVDRILKGEKPADLPVQAPTKYELVINLKTARALGLEVPPSLLARADEVIE
jgi:putative tryptophan/tyrosine transport system substrate-binding protein